MKRFEYIYTTLTLHKYRNNNYCTKYQQTGTKGVGFTTQKIQNQEPKSRCCTESCFFLFVCFLFLTKGNKVIQSCSVLLWKVPPSPLQDGLPCEWNSALPERPRVQFKGWRWKHHRAAATQPRPLRGRSLLHEPNNKTSRWDVLWEDAAFGTEHYRSALHNAASAPPPPQQGSWIPIWNVDLLDNLFFLCVLESLICTEQLILQVCNMRHYLLGIIA